MTRNILISLICVGILSACATSTPSENNEQSGDQQNNQITEEKEYDPEDLEAARSAIREVDTTVGRMEDLNMSAGALNEEFEF
jgi:hypothetical protein